MEKHIFFFADGIGTQLIKRNILKIKLNFISVPAKKVNKVKKFLKKLYFIFLRIVYITLFNT